MPRFVRNPVAGLFALALLAGLGYGAWRGYGSWRASAHVRTAQEQTAAYHYEAAYEQMKRAVALRPGRADVQFLTARAARRVMDMAGAKEHLDKYAKLAGKTDDYSFESQLFDAQAGSATSFIRDTLWQRAQSDATNRALILEALLRGALETYRLGEARQFVDAWLVEPTDDARPYFWRGAIYEQYGESLKEKALQDYQLSLSKNPDFDECRLQLAQLQLRTGRTTDARPHFEELHRRRPDNPDIAVGLAQCLDGAGDTDSAEKLLDQVLARHGTHPGALAERGRLLLDHGRAADAEPWLRKAYDAMPQDPTASYNLYRCLQQQGKDKEAEEQRARHDAMTAKRERLQKLIHDAVTTRQNDPAVMSEIGALYLETGRPEWVEMGRVWLERALAADPAYKPAYAALAQYYDRTNRPTLADQCRAKAK